MLKIYWQKNKIKKIIETSFYNELNNSNEQLLTFQLLYIGLWTHLIVNKLYVTLIRVF